MKNREREADSESTWTWTRMLPARFTSVLVKINSTANKTNLALQSFFWSLFYASIMSTITSRQALVCTSRKKNILSKILLRHNDDVNGWSLQPPQRSANISQLTKISSGFRKICSFQSAAVSIFACDRFQLEEH